MTHPFSSLGATAATSTLLAVVLLQPALSTAGEVLSLDAAVAAALERHDPSVAAYLARGDALDERAVADGQFPDPQVRFGLANWPTDTFDFEQEPMTQIQAGLRQSFPRGRSLEIKASQRSSEADIQRAAADLAELDIALAVRRAWLELFYWSGAADIVARSSDAVAELVDVVEASFAIGLQSNQDLLRAELELSLQEDRAIDVTRQIEQVRATLARYLGYTLAAMPLPASMPALPVPPTVEALVANLAAHPAVRAEDARIDVAEHAISLAEQEYRPGLMVDVGYGIRGAGRADFASVMVSMDIPLFTERRQDKRLAAAQTDTQATRYGRDVRLLEMRKMVAEAVAAHTRLAERIDLYERVVQQRADEAASAALDGYQSQVTDFAELIRAQLAALETAQKLLRLRVDYAAARAQLLYLAGASR